MKIKFHCECNFVGCDGEDELEVNDDTTDEQLDNMAWDYAMDYIQPSGWWEKVEEEDE
jgi:hypothetical protein